MRWLRFAAAVAAGVALTACAGVAAAATLITYTVTGSDLGAFVSPGGQLVAAFDAPVEFDFTGTLPGTTSLGGVHYVTLTGGTFTGGGVTGDINFASGGLFGINDFGGAGFGPLDSFQGGSPPIVLSGGGLLGYDGFHSLAPVPLNSPAVEEYGFGPVAITSGGQPLVVQTSRMTGIYFSASVATVPEAATWSLMILGFGAAGAALRLRRSHSFG
jgi:hypothetical protein